MNQLFYVYNDKRYAVPDLFHALVEIAEIPDGEDWCLYHDDIGVLCGCTDGNTYLWATLHLSFYHSTLYHTYTDFNVNRVIEVFEKFRKNDSQPFDVPLDVSIMTTKETKVYTGTINDFIGGILC